MALHFDLTDMQLMVNVAGASSLTKGAELSCLSVPAASNRVKNLEMHLGTALLYRTSQGVTLTPPGDAFVHHARVVLRQLEHLRGDMQEYAQGIKGSVRVFANTTAINEFIPAVLERYLVEHPDVNIELRERLSYQVVKAVADGAADIGVSALDSGGSEMEFVPYRSDWLTLVTHVDHPLAKFDSQNFQDTLDYDYVGLFEASAIHSFLMKAADDIGRVLRERVEVSSFEAACRMIAAQVGIGIIPRSAARRYAKVMPLKLIALNDDWALRKLHICMLDTDKLPVFAKDLVTMLMQDAEEHSGDVTAKRHDIAYAAEKCG